MSKGPKDVPVTSDARPTEENLEAMSERARLRAFDALKEQRHVTERYGVSVVVIGCEHCHDAFERGRNEGRRSTIQDRLEAVRHLLMVHGIYPTPAEGGAS